MTDQQHPVTPPQELIEQWIRDANHNEPMFAQVAIMGARWGADTELEACCEWLKSAVASPAWIKELRAARRPKPLSLKEQALAALNEIEDKMLGPTIEEKLIRRALESLPS